MILLYPLVAYVIPFINVEVMSLSPELLLFIHVIYILVYGYITVTCTRYIVLWSYTTATCTRYIVLWLYVTATCARYIVLWLHHCYMYPVYCVMVTSLLHVPGILCFSPSTMKPNSYFSLLKSTYWSCRPEAVNIWLIDPLLVEAAYTLSSGLYTFSCLTIGSMNSEERLTLSRTDELIKLSYILSTTLSHKCKYCG